MHHSRYITLLFLAFLFNHVQLNAQTTYISSGAGGDWSDATTWSNAGVPGNTDHAIISTGTVVTHNSNEVITRLYIQAGAELVSNARLNIDGAYTINGNHSGTGRVQLRNGNDSISGTGSITTTTIMRVNNKRTIIAGSNIIRTGQNIRCPNNDTLFNFGTLTTNRALTGNASTTFYNGTGANLNIQ